MHGMQVSTVQAACAPAAAHLCATHPRPAASGLLCVWVSFAVLAVSEAVVGGQRAVWSMRVPLSSALLSPAGASRAPTPLTRLWCAACLATAVMTAHVVCQRRTTPAHHRAWWTGRLVFPGEEPSALALFLTFELLTRVRAADAHG